MKHKTTLLISTILFGFLGSVNDFTIQSSKLRDIEENAFDGTHQRLHTLSIHNFQIKAIVNGQGMEPLVGAVEGVLLNIAEFRWLDGKVIDTT